MEKHWKKAQDLYYPLYLSVTKGIYNVGWIETKGSIPIVADWLWKCDREQFSAELIEVYYPGLKCDQEPFPITGKKILPLGNLNWKKIRWKKFIEYWPA